jgi:hypothetical protein
VKALEQLPEEVNIILLVDWPSADIPCSLVQAGFTVYSYSPDGYKQVLIATAKPVDRGVVHAAELRTGKDKLVFRPMDHSPESVDLVTIYRPPEEHAVIIRDHVIPLAAKSIWLQSPLNQRKQRR